MNASADEEVPFDFHKAGSDGLDEIIQNLVRDPLVERAFVAVAPEIELQTLEFYAVLPGNIHDADRSEIRLAGFRTDASEFRTFEPDFIVPSRIRIFENFQFFGWL